MDDDIDKFIKEICNGECQEYFESSKKHSYRLIKKALPPNILSKKLDNEVQFEIAIVASRIIKKLNQIDKNRFWILYYRLAEELITIKCNQCRRSIERLMCVEYILDRLFEQIKAFDVYAQSIPFQEANKNIIEIGKIYSSVESLNIDIDPKKLKYTSGIVTNYTQKILKKYSKDTIDVDTIEALIENILLDVKKVSITKRADSYIEREVLGFFNNSKREINRVIEPILTELLYIEKFFNYIYNHFIDNRFIDFTRRVKKQIPKPEPNREPPVANIGLEDILENYLELIDPTVQLILKLKIGERVKNQEFIKVAYLFDYREIDIFKHFNIDEVLQIRLYAKFNAQAEYTKKLHKKISKVREKLKADSYINREDEIKRVALLKLIFSEEMSAKEIGVLLDYKEKQVYKKIENVKNKIRYKKELALCERV